MVSSNPYHPLHLQWGITHAWMGESWMVDGEASVMVMAMISSKSPSRQGARTEFLVPNWGFWWRLRSGTFSGKTSNPPLFLGHGASYSRRRGRVEVGGGHTTPRRGLAWAAPRPGVGPSWLFSVSSSGSVSLRVKYELCDIFRDFYRKLDFCTKTRHQSNSAENSVSPC